MGPDGDGWSLTSSAATALSRLRASDLVDLVLPRQCGGCLRAGDDWCPRCARALAGLAFDTSAGGRGTARGTGPQTADVGVGVGGGGPWVVPHPAPDGMPRVYAWGVYADPLRAAVSAWKDAGRRDLRAVLAPLLAESIAGALRGGGWQDGVVLVIPAPSSRRAVRQRGDTPMEGLCQGAVAALAGHPGPVLRVAPALRHLRRVEDQSGLGTSERRGNLSGALEVKPLWQRVVHGRRCVLVDDVVTTGATLAEAARALRRAGAGAVVGASMAATQRTRG
ncbi:ComF family protein [Terrabacter sp. BE26]|uniref:ComF family protein n=1 Tax=Terrabacter sp. BE26 TaxID=2898152 RepID=UPI0035BE830D